eukprot:2617962-Lingulodinium_polyedra.AAC.1
MLRIVRQGGSGGAVTKPGAPPTDSGVATEPWTVVYEAALRAKAMDLKDLGGPANSDASPRPSPGPSCASEAVAGGR